MKLHYLKLFKLLQYYKRLYNLLFIIIIFIIILNLYPVKIKAEGFNRVKREEFKISFLSGLSFNCYRFTNGQYYYFTPYIYLMFEPLKDFEINVNLPFDINFEKYYKQQQYYDENLELKVKEFNVFNYYGGLSNPSIGFQYTYYTNTINDIYLNISIPTGYFPMFYFRNGLENSISEGYFDISGGIKSSFITDPVIINYGIGFSFNFKPLFLYDEGDEFYYRIGFNGSFGYTEVLNYVLSYFINLRFYFNLPEYKELFLIKDKELYSFILYLKFGVSINLDENSSFILSLSNSLTDGVLNPYFDVYFNFKIK